MDILLDGSECISNQMPASLLETICRKIEDNNNEIKDEDIAVLYSVFGKELERSLELIEENCFELVSIGNTNRTYIVVHGSSGIYTLYPKVNFCQCYSYKINISKRKSFICKHIIGSKLAVALKKYKTRSSLDFIYHNMSENNTLI